MAQQTINVGASANDGTGSPLRTAFQYTNSNFTELYAALGGGSGLPGSTNQVLFNNGTAIAGDAGMTYNPSTDTMTLVNLVLSGTFAARNGDTPSAIRAAASDYAAVDFDGATASTRITSTLTGQNIGTGDFSVWARFRVPASVNAANRGLIALTSNSTSTVQAESAHLYLASNAGELVFRLYGATASDVRQATINVFLSAYTGQVVDVVVTRTGTTLKIFINGTDTAYIEGTSGTAPAWSATVTSTFCNVGMAVGTSLFNSRIYRSVVFNRALSASDVTELITTGVNPADQWGTQTQIVGFNPAVLNGDFELWSVAGTAGVSNGTMTDWSIVSTGAGNTVTRNGTSPISGTFDALFTMGATAGLAYVLPLSATTVIGKRYRAQISAKRISGTGNLNVSSAVTNLSLKTIVLTTGSVVNDSTEYVADSARPYWNCLATNTVIQVDDASITRIGAIVDLDFTVGAGYQATDRSTNNLHGTLFNGVSFTDTKKVAVVYATTNTNGNQQMLGTLAIPTNAIIEDIIVNSTGSATVSVGNASAGTQIVNGASVVSGRQKLTLATPFSTTGNLWVNSSSTATLQFTILYTVAA